MLNCSQKLQTFLWFFSQIFFKKPLLHGKNTSVIGMMFNEQIRKYYIQRQTNESEGNFEIFTYISDLVSKILYLKQFFSTLFSFYLINIFSGYDIKNYFLLEVLIIWNSTSVSFLVLCHFPVTIASLKEPKLHFDKICLTLVFLGAICTFFFCVFLLDMWVIICFHLFSSL